MVVKIAYTAKSNVESNFEYTSIPSWDVFDTSSTKPNDILKNFLHEELWVWDSDVSRTEKYIVGIKINDDYSWYSVEHYFSPIWSEEGFEVYNEFETKKIEKPKNMPLDRNWYYPRSRSFPEINNWPPKTIEGFILRAAIDKMGK